MASERRQTEVALRGLLDDPKFLAELLRYGMQRNPSVSLGLLDEFGAMRAVHQAIRQQAPKVRSWMVQEAGCELVDRVTNQFVTYARTQSEAYARAAQAAGEESIRELVALVRGGGDLDDAAETAVCGLRADLAGERDNLLGAMTTQARCVKDTCLTVAENIALRWAHESGRADG